eukprot:TRINITY_DN66816_c8_g3_i1.p1 TRINITY_DN66816_c8_g3~~TRINITY_DN66816_c8_g3_i1.p1  ORF type:complete len:1190 (-),score=639.76 TRINITY_DN66816_c8_g3_i1:69-3638(-)
MHCSARIVLVAALVVCCSVAPHLVQAASQVASGERWVRDEVLTITELSPVANNFSFTNGSRAFPYRSADFTTPLDYPFRGPNTAALSPDGKYMYQLQEVGGAGTPAVAVFNLQAGTGDPMVMSQLVEQFTLGGGTVSFTQVQSLVMSPDGKFVYVVDGSATLRILRFNRDASTGALDTTTNAVSTDLIASSTTPLNQTTVGMAIPPTGDLLAVTVGRLVGTGDLYTVGPHGLYVFPRTVATGDLAAAAFQARGFLSDVAVSTDGKFVYALAATAFETGLTHFVEHYSFVAPNTLTLETSSGDYPAGEWATVLSAVKQSQSNLQRVNGLRLQVSPDNKQLFALLVLQLNTPGASTSLIFSWSLTAATGNMAAIGAFGLPSNEPVYPADPSATLTDLRDCGGGLSMCVNAHSVLAWCTPRRELNLVNGAQRSYVLVFHRDDTSTVQPKFAAAHFVDNQIQLAGASTEVLPTATVVRARADGQVERYFDVLAPTEPLIWGAACDTETAFFHGLTSFPNTTLNGQEGFYKLSFHRIAPTAVSYTGGSNYISTLVGTNISSLTPTVTPSTAAGVTYSVSPSLATLPGTLAFDSKTGAFSGIPSSAFEDRTFVVVASNTGGSASTVVTIVAKDVKPSFTYPNATSSGATSKFNFTVGRNSSYVPTVVTSASTVTFSIAPPLPVGLAIDVSTGAISGTPHPTAAFTANGVTLTDYTVTATNAGGSTSVTLRIGIVTPLPLALQYASTPVSYEGNVTIAPNFPLHYGDGAIASFSVSPSLSEETGLTFDNVTGVISGSPTRAVLLKEFTVTGFDQSKTQSIVTKLIVSVYTKQSAKSAQPPSGLRFATNPATYVRQQAAAVSNVLSNDGGEAVKVTVSPPLPAGLQMNADGTALVGQPTVSVSNTLYTVTLSNSFGSASVSLFLTVTEPKVDTLSVGKTEYEFITGNAAAVSAPTVAGGAADSFSIVPNPPVGMTFSTTTGALSGTPTQTMLPTSFVITGTNTGGSASMTITIQVSNRDGTFGSAKDIDVASGTELKEVRTIAVVAMVSVFFISFVALLTFLAWRSGHRPPQASVVSDEVLNRLQRSISQSAMRQSQTTSSMTRGGEPHSTTSKPRDIQLQVVNEPDLPANQLTRLFRRLGIDERLAQPFIEEQLSIADIEYLTSEELRRLMPQKGPRKRLTRYIKTNAMIDANDEH